MIYCKTFTTLNTFILKIHLERAIEIHLELSTITRTIFVN